jgi:Domain of unknown function (DUF4157)
VSRGDRDRAVRPPATREGDTAARGPAPSTDPLATARRVVRAPGRPLDEDTRRSMASRFRRDFSEVRVHTDPAAARSAAGLGALAYTAGRDVVFAAGRFAPGTREGDRLLAHELAHVAQQPRPAPPSPVLGLAGPGAPAERAADRAAAHPEAATRPGPGAGPGPATGLRPGAASTTLLYRQQGQQAGVGTQAQASTFSVNQSTYLQTVNQGIGLISGNIVESNTLAGMVRPMLQAMAGSVVWRDSTGRDQGGSAITWTVPGTAPPVSVKLKLVLDDQASPPDLGHFDGVGTSDGTITLRITKNSTADEVASTLFHESQHLMAWLVNRVLPAKQQQLSPSAPVKALTMSRFGAQIQGVRGILGNLATSVNGRRQAAGRTAITQAGLDRMAPWLFEEVQVRAETEVFSQSLQVQQARARGGVAVFVPTMANQEVNRPVIDRYVFEHSGVFDKTDQTALTPNDVTLLDTLTKILEGNFQLQVRRQFSLSAYTIGMGMPRAPVQMPQTPLPQPNFRPLPTP